MTSTMQNEMETKRKSKMKWKGTKGKRKVLFYFENRYVTLYFEYPFVYCIVETVFRAAIPAYSNAMALVYVYVQSAVLSYKSCLMYRNKPVLS